MLGQAASVETVVGKRRETPAVSQSGGSAHGVGVLADELAAVLDELLRAFLLGGLVIPAAGEGDFHRGSGQTERAPRKKEV